MKKAKVIGAIIGAGLLTGEAVAAGETADQQAAQSGDSSPSEIERVIVRAVPLEQDVLPTRRSFNSVYGLDLNVLDTPRNVTVVSTTQLEAIDVRDPRDFSLLTSSSYTDSSFGSPLVPRIRGQYADLYYNGMRDSFVTSGNGAPLSFNSVESVNIIKGPASVSFGAGPGVGGAVDIVPKYPKFSGFQGSAGVEFGSEGERRWNVDVSGPVVGDKLAVRLSYAGEDSDSYYVNLYDRQHAVYGALAFRPNSDYTLDVQTEAVVADYTENVGINRVNQDLIDHGTYLRGTPVSTLLYSFDPSSPTPVGTASNPYAGATGILTETVLGNATQVNPRITLDSTPGTGGESLKIHTNIIQTLHLADDATITNNTFVNYENRDKVGFYYYANSFKDNYSIENKTDYKKDFTLDIGGSSFKNSIDAGFSARFAHTNVITNFDTEPASIYDLTGNPGSWKLDSSIVGYGTYLYKSANGLTLYGAAGRDSTNGGDSNISDTYDLAPFYEQRIEFDPRFSFLFGGRVDFIRADIRDPLGGDVLINGYPESTSTSWHALPNYNFSPVYRMTPTTSVYFSYNYSQNLNGGGANGGVWTYGKTTDQVFHQASELFEGGIKSSLLDNSLFATTSVFRQTKAVPIGAASTQTAQATIRGVEAEVNYQPTAAFYLTASYSYIQTQLNQPASFYDYAAEPGLNIDGAGLFAVFKDGQTYKDPGVPEHVFNFLANYKTDYGLGYNVGLQVTGPIETTTSGYLDLSQSLFVPNSVIANGGYYKSPVIPWQYTLNAAVSYTYAAYEAKLSLFNVTDQKNWSAANPFYGNDFLIRELPFHVMGSLKVRF